MRQESYSYKVKDELLGVMPKALHCKIAEAAGIFSVLGTIEADAGRKSGYSLKCCINADDSLKNKYFTLLSKTNILRKCNFQADALLDQEAEDFLKMIKWDPNRPFVTSTLLLQQPCCKRAYLRGVFLSAGSLTDPNKRYHLEIVTKSMDQATEIMEIMETFSLKGKLARRQNRDIIYLKESDQISDMLSVMEAPHALMDFENIRVQKDLHNAVNRKVNCETANIGKMVDAAVRELSDIELIEKTIGLKALSPKLQETAEIRSKHPDSSLKELGELFDPPVGKSGVNHRLRRISEIAMKIRNQEESQQL